MSDEHDPITPENQAMMRRSGNVELRDPFASLFYLLLRQHILPGDLEGLVRQIEKEDVAWDAEQQRTVLRAQQFCNGWLALYAKDISDRLARLTR